MKRRRICGGSHPAPRRAVQNRRADDAPVTLRRFMFAHDPENRFASGSGPGHAFFGIML
jgi:hypothetical protein